MEFHLEFHPGWKWNSTWEKPSEEVEFHLRRKKPPETVEFHPGKCNSTWGSGIPPGEAEFHLGRIVDWGIRIPPGKAEFHLGSEISPREADFHLGKWNFITSPSSLMTQVQSRWNSTFPGGNPCPKCKSASSSGVLLPRVSSKSSSLTSFSRV